MSRKRIQVLHVITRLDRGGSAENTLLTATRVDPDRFAAEVAVGPTQGPASPTEVQARQKGVRFTLIPHLVRPLSPIRDLLALRELSALMRRGQYQIVHTHTSKGGLLGRLAARLTRVPAVVHTPHGHVFYGYYGRWLTWLFVEVERWAARWADRIVALTAREVQDYLKLGIGRSGQLVVIPSGVDFEPFDRESGGREEVRSELGIPTGALVIGTLGRLTAVKGQADLVAAFARLLSQAADAYLLLVGEGEERPALEAQARSLGVAERVVFTGWREDVPRMLRAFDLFVLPSLNEGMGKALVEAMYVGLPVVATAVGGVPELVESGSQGILVEPGAPERLAAVLAELAADPVRRQRLGQQARLRAAEYSVERMIEKIEALYEELIEEKGIAATAMA